MVFNALITNAENLISQHRRFLLKADAVLPGCHMNEVHWNTVLLDGSIPVAELERMMDRSYGLVVKSLKKAERQALEIRHGHVVPSIELDLNQG